MEIKFSGSKPVLTFSKTGENEGELKIKISSQAGPLPLNIEVVVSLTKEDVKILFRNILEE